jgi:hypothetical protein
MTAPLVYQWDGEAMRPLPRFARQADREFVIGELYRLVVQEERSAASHAQFFAALNDAWQNLPEDQAERFPSVEHLRKWALIQAGFADERSIVCGSKAEAQRVGAFVRPFDEYAVVIVRDAVVKVFTAQSQSMRAMGKPEFERSKRATLEIVARMIGVSADDLKQHSEAS